MERGRPFFITASAVVAGLAAIYGFLTTLQMLGLFPLYLGEVAFFGQPVLGAVLWGLLTLGYIWALQWLWRLEPSGWLFAIVSAGLGLILALFSIAGGSTLESMLPALILNGLILLFLVFPHTREAFGPRPYA